MLGSILSLSGDDGWLHSGMLSLRVVIKFFCIFSIGPLVADDSHHLSGVGHDSGLDALTFTGTQKWAAKYLERKNDAARYFPADWKEKFQTEASDAAKEAFKSSHG